MSAPGTLETHRCWHASISTEHACFIGRSVRSALLIRCGLCVSSRLSPAPSWSTASGDDGFSPRGTVPTRDSGCHMAAHGAAGKQAGERAAGERAGQPGRAMALGTAGGPRHVAVQLGARESERTSDARADAVRAGEVLAQEGPLAKGVLSAREEGAMGSKSTADAAISARWVRWLCPSLVAKPSQALLGACPELPLPEQGLPRAASPAPHCPACRGRRAPLPLSPCR